MKLRSFAGGGAEVLGRHLRILLLGALIPFALCGCERLFENRAQQQLLVAEKKFAQQDYLGAVLTYESALDGTPKTVEIHYKLALIYDDQLRQPISAMHHFQRYLDLAPAGDHAKEARGFLKADQLRLSTAIGNGATVPQQEAVRLKNDNLALRKKVEDLHTELEAASKARAQAFKLAGKAGVKFEQIQKPLVAGARTYTVEPGDTLASISRKFYKGAGRWKDIQDANFNTLEGTARLKPGMVLMIP